MVLFNKQLIADLIYNVGKPSCAFNNIEMIEEPSAFSISLKDNFNAIDLNN
jgi:hypothetical protein